MNNSDHEKKCRFRNKCGKVALIGLLVLMVAFALFRYSGGCAQAAAPVEVPAAETKTVTQWWTCSMHPQIHLPHPGKCPICGMALIPQNTDDMGAGSGVSRELAIGPDAAKLMQIETTPVERKFVQADVRMVGNVVFDETRTAFITARMPGRLDRLFVDYTGVSVKKGNPLASIYSPELLSAQQELLQAIDSVQALEKSESTVVRDLSQATVEAVREKLRLWGVTPDQIQEIEAHGKPMDQVTLFAPVGGIVIQKDAREGSYVKTGDRIYTVADLSRVWVQLEAYASDLLWLRYGQKVTFTTEAWPGETFAGTIAFIDPVFDPVSRTVHVRVNVDNPEQKMKPGMFVNATAHPLVAEDGKVVHPTLTGKWICPMHPEVMQDVPGTCDLCGMALVADEELGYVAPDATPAPLVIPATAPLLTGTRAVVYVEVPGQEQPIYEGREIMLGPKAGDFYMVHHGLQEGERVVTRGAFKLDAELQIRAQPSMMAPAGGIAPMDHSKMKMDP